MTNLLLPLLLSAQLMTAEATPLPQQKLPPMHAERLMWGLIDPELSAWFAQLPDERTEDDAPRVLWDWSWQGLLAALFGDSLIKEVPADGTHL